MAECKSRVQVCVCVCVAAKYTAAYPFLATGTTDAPSIKEKRSTFAHAFGPAMILAYLAAGLDGRWMADALLLTDLS